MVNATNQNYLWEYACKRYGFVDDYHGGTLKNELHNGRG